MTDFSDTGVAFIPDARQTDYFKFLDKASSEVELFLQRKIKARQKWSSRDGAFKLLVDVHRKSPVFLDILQSDDVRQIVAEVFGDTPCFVNSSKLSFKMAGVEQTWFPHQDGVYKPNREIRGITVAILLEDITATDGCLVLYPGSAKLGVLPHEVIFHANESEPQVRIANMPAIEPISFYGKKGALAYFDFRTIHSSGPNLGTGTRPMFLFEIEAIEGIPFELDAKEAICFNFTYRRNAYYWWRRTARYTRNIVIFPVLKKLMFISKKLGLYRKLELRGSN
jgi:hypothetical protein